MSTKIYNGFAYTVPSRSSQDGLMAMTQFVQAFRKTLAPLAVRKTNRWFVQRAVQIADRARIFPGQHQDKPHYSPLSIAYTDFIDMTVKLDRGERCPDIDCEVSVTVFPASRTTWYGILFTEWNEARTRWFRHPAIHEYGYWNNTDRPDRCSEREWDARRRVWDRLLPGSAIPAQHGWSFTVYPTTASFPSKQTLARIYRHHLPSFERRVGDLAIDLVFQELDVPKGQLSSYTRAFLDLRNGVSPHQETYRRYVEKIGRRLPAHPPLTYLMDPLTPVLQR